MLELEGQSMYHKTFGNMIHPMRALVELVKVVIKQMKPSTTTTEWLDGRACTIFGP